MVYFIREDTLDGLVKIGYCRPDRDPYRRAEELQVGNGRQLQVEAVLPDAGLATEAWLHRAFAGARLKGEWFRPTPELLRLISAIKKDPGSFPRFMEVEVSEPPRPGRPRKVTKKDKLDRLAKQIESGEVIVRNMPAV